MMTKESIAAQLERGRRIFESYDEFPQVRAALATIGYDQDVMTQGRTLFTAATQAETLAHGGHADQLDATRTLKALRARVEDEIGALTQTVRALYGDDPPTLERLGLRLGQRATPELATPDDRPDPEGETTPTPPRRRSTSQTALIQRGRLLYDGIDSDPAIMARLERAGYTAEQLAEGRALLQQFQTADTKQEGRKAEAMTATSNQHAALDALNDWIAELSGVARARLRNQPEILDKLGIPSR